MDSSEILKFCLEKGLLLDKDLLSFFSENSDIESAKLILENIKKYTNQRVITKNIFYENKDRVNELFSGLPQEKQGNLEKLKIKLGLSIEISREVQDKNEKVYDIKPVSQDDSGEVKVFKNYLIPGRKLEFKDFLAHYKDRFSSLRNILQSHSELDDLVSISKISGDRQTFSVIGMVYDKRVTKNKNILLEIEDLTGKMRVLINKDKEDLYEKAQEILVDNVIGFKGSGNKEIIFVNELFFPDAALSERKKSPVEEYALFIGDLHFGSKLFLKDSFMRFIDYLNGKVPGTEEEVSKIKYLFLVGDLVTGVGNYPNQEGDLEIKDLEEQYLQLAGLLGKIDKRIKLIVSAGNHDGVRLMEPQPILDERYAWPLYDLENIHFTSNPSEVNIGSRHDFYGFNILTYHGFSYPYYVNNVSRLMLGKCMNQPDEIMKYLLRARHLSPSHASNQFFPSHEDNLVIRDVPDIFVSGHTHKSAVSYYNNILIISVSCWESLTSYQIKFGNNPDHCKVPMFNLKTRSVKILDFE
tara:strand:+ start:13698 stop:15272 length:1575 start_codon:yes stop_codon:yes gene_type:complete